MTAAVSGWMVERDAGGVEHSSHVELVSGDGAWSIHVNGRRLVDRESYTVAHRIYEQLTEPRPEPSEASEVAESIRAWLRSARPAEPAR